MRRTRCDVSGSLTNPDEQAIKRISEEIQKKLAKQYQVSDPIRLVVQTSYRLGGADFVEKIRSGLDTKFFFNGPFERIYLFAETSENGVWRKNWELIWDRKTVSA